MIIEQQRMQSDMAMEIVQNKKDRIVSFQVEVRNRQIEEHKKKVRQQKQAISTLNYLLQNIPSNLQQITVWCQQALIQFGKSQNFEISPWKTVQLFKLVERYPCLQTIELLRATAYKLSPSAIHDLFQHDVAGLLHRIILFPEKVTTKTINQNEQRKLIFVQLDLVRNCLLTLSVLCQQSERARNFIVVNHKSFLCINKAYQRFGNQIRAQWLTTLYSFTKYKVFHDEQFIRIVKKLILIFCDNTTKHIGELRIAIKALKNILKSKQKWAIDLIESTMQYDVIDRILSLMKLYHTRQALNIQNGQNYDKQFGQLLHHMNLFIIYYIQISTNQYFNWNAFFQEWFFILNQKICNPYYSAVKKDVYFIIKNNFSENDQTVSPCHIYTELIYSFKCIKVFADNLQFESDPDIINQLAQAIGALFTFRKVQDYGQEIIDTNLIGLMIETAINKRMFLASTGALYFLLNALFELFQKTQSQSLKRQFSYIVQCYEMKLLEVAKICTLEQEYSEIIDNILKQAQNC